MGSVPDNKTMNLSKRRDVKMLDDFLCFINVRFAGYRSVLRTVAFSDSVKRP